MIIQKRFQKTVLGDRTDILEVKVNKNFDFVFTITSFYKGDTNKSRKVLMILKYNQVINIATHARVQASMRFNNLIDKLKGG